MSVMLSKTYRAIVSAGAPVEEAREAAEEIADFDTRLAGIECQVSGLQQTKWLVSVLVLYLAAWSLQGIWACWDRPGSEKMQPSRQSSRL